MVPFAAAPTIEKGKHQAPMTAPLLRFGTPPPRRGLHSPESPTEIQIPISTATVAAGPLTALGPFPLRAPSPTLPSVPHARGFLCLSAGPSRGPCFPPAPGPRRPFSGAPGPAHHPSPRKPGPPARTLPSGAPPARTQLPEAPPPLLRPRRAAMPPPAKLYPPAPGCVALPADMATGSAQPPANYPATTFPSLPPPTPSRTAPSGRKETLFR